MTKYQLCKDFLSRCFDTHENASQKYAELVPFILCIIRSF